MDPITCDSVILRIMFSFPCLSSASISKSYKTEVQDRLNMSRKEYGSSMFEGIAAVRRSARNAHRPHNLTS
jgi:hypothetical protein